MSDGTEQHRQDTVDGIEYSIYMRGVCKQSGIVKVASDTCIT